MSDEKILPKGVVRSKEPFTTNEPSPPSPLSVKRKRELGGEGIRANKGIEPERVPTITALTAQQKDTNRVSISIDGKFALGVFADVVNTLGLRIGMEITPDRLEEIATAETRRKAREDAYRLLSYRSRSEHEIADRLQRKGYDPEVIAETQGHLRAHGLLNDEVFARSVIEARGRTHGRAAIAFELRRKGIDPETANCAMQETLDAAAEQEAALREAIRRVGQNPTDRSPQARSRLAASLARRGFGWDSIRPVLAAIYGSREDDGSADADSGQGADAPE